MTPIELSEVLACFDLVQEQPHRYRAPNMAYYGPGRDIVFAGQLIGQAITAATASVPGKSVKTLSSQFPRGGRVSEETELAVNVLNAGKTFAVATVSASQGDRLISESLVLLHEPDPDFIRHGGEGGLALLDPDAAERKTTSVEGYLTGMVDGVDYMDPADVGPAAMKVWVKFEGAPSDPTIGQALIAMASTPFLIGIAMRPHEGLTVAQSHANFSSGVMGHTITFHEPAPASEWLLFDQVAPYAGRGRSFGRGDVYARSGELVASFSQDGMIRGLVESEATANARKRL